MDIAITLRNIQDRLEQLEERFAAIEGVQENKVQQISFDQYKQYLGNTQESFLEVAKSTCPDIAVIRQICWMSKEAKSPLDEACFLSEEDFNTLKLFIQATTKPISVAKGVMRKNTIRYAYLNFIVDSFCCHPLIEQLDSRKLNGSAFLNYQAIINEFGREMCNFVFGNEPTFKCKELSASVQGITAEAFAKLLKDRLTDRFSANANYVPKANSNKKLRTGIGCYININSHNKLTNCNNTHNNTYLNEPYGTYSASVSCEIDDERDDDDPYSGTNSSKGRTTSEVPQYRPVTKSGAGEIIIKQNINSTNLKTYDYVDVWSGKYPSFRSDEA